MAVAVIAVAACAPSTPHWTKPGVTVPQLEADRAECLAWSQEYFPTGETRPDYAALERCMTRKGYAVERRR